MAVATLGNVLGSLVNWLLGRYIERWHRQPWFPVKHDTFAIAQIRYRRFGYWSLLASWVPLIGDPITVVASAMREPLWRFLLLVTLAKGGRYVVLAAAILGMLS